MYPTNKMSLCQPSDKRKPSHAEAPRPGQPIGPGDDYTFDSLLASIDRLSGWMTSWLAPDPKRFDYAVL